MPLDTQQIELISRNWLTTELLIAGYEVAFPLRDSGVDMLLSPADYSWTMPVQIKCHRERVMAVHRKYLGKPVAIAYVILGEAAQALPLEEEDAFLRKGNDFSCRTMWFTPEEAWKVPGDSGKKHDREKHNGYRFTWATKSVLPLVEDKTALSRSRLTTVVERARAALGYSSRV